jgi:cytochrome c-type biogenesis protein CcmE
MNSVMKRKLIIATLAIVVVIILVLAVVGGGGFARTATVADAASGNVGDGKIQVSGEVVSNSFRTESGILYFSLYDSSSGDTSKILNVQYSGAVSSTFGNGVTAICTGKMNASGTLIASEMVTKCPSKYESAEGAMTVGDLLSQTSQMVGKQTEVAGYIKAGTLQPAGFSERFVLYSQGAEVSVKFDGALPDGIVEESSIVVNGSLNSDGTFTATNVAQEKIG